MSSAGCEGGVVGSEGAVELAGDEAFEAADGFFLGLAFGEAAVHVAAGSFAVVEPDEDDHVQGSVGCAVAGEVEPVAVGAPAGGGDRRGGAQVREGRLGAEPVDVLARGDEQGRGVVRAASETGHCGGRHSGDQPVELLAQRGGGGDEQVAELAQRGGAGLDGAVAGDPELADRLDDSGGVLSGCGRSAPRRSRVTMCGCRSMDPWLVDWVRIVLPAACLVSVSLCDFAEELCGAGPA